jgi:hypothetical protein
LLPTRNCLADPPFPAATTIIIIIIIIIIFFFFLLHRALRFYFLKTREQTFGHWRSPGERSSVDVGSSTYPTSV